MQWHGNSCYFPIHEEKPWSDSRKDCTDKNATPLKIDSIKERVGLTPLQGIEITHTMKYVS